MVTNMGATAAYPVGIKLLSYNLLFIRIHNLEI